MPLPIFIHSSLSLAGGGKYPTNTSLPTIVGTAQAGQVLVSHSGVWLNTPTSYAIQWQRNQNGVTNIPGASGVNYTVANADVGTTLDVMYTATNIYGSASAISALTATVTAAGSAPANTVLPAVTGTAIVGDVLTTSNGTWTNSPTSYGYVWQRNRATNIGGAISSSYTVASADLGDTLNSVVTAINSFGSTPASSASTATVTTGGTPMPNIPSGLVTVGALLTPSDATMLNPASDIWDIGAGGHKLHSQANGSATTNNPAYAKYGQSYYGGATDSYLHLSTGNATGVWMVSQVYGDSRNAENGGAATGFLMPASPAKWVLEFSVKVGGSASNKCYGWSSPWTDNIYSNGSNASYEEIDVFEVAGWSGSGSPGIGSTTFHYSGGSKSTYPSGTPADGNFHTYTLVMTGGSGSTQYVIWDGTVVATRVGTVTGAVHYIQLMTGYSSSSVLPSGGVTGSNMVEADMVISYIRVWAAT